MWKNWKKKVSDFFFEEIYEEDDDIDSGNDISLKNEGNRTVSTRVTYQYPKDQQTPFRFPVIPDEQSAATKPNRAVYERSQQQNSFIANEREMLIHGYNRKKQADELEEVPAFMRRIKQAKQDASAEKKEAKQEKNEMKDLLAYSTRPEELDRVFRKRDKLSEKEAVEQQMEESAATSEMILDPLVDAASPQEPNLSEKTKGLHFPEESRTKRGSSEDEKEPIETTLASYDQVQSETEDEHGKALESDIDLDIPNYLLNDPTEPDGDDAAWLKEQQSLLEQTLSHFNVNAKIVNVTQGPSVTRFEIQPALGVKVSRIRNLADDIKLNMAAKDIRIEAPIPGKNTIGIEVPNKYPQVVTLQEIIETDTFENAESPLTVALGLTIEGEPLITNIGKMPHGLIAGATGSGKSVCINAILLSLLYKANMDEVKFLLIDPKMVELTPYNGIPHLVSPVITDPKAATMALKWAVDEMENRYEKFVAAGVRNLEKYNEKMEKENQEKLPYLVIVIDELADLMIVSPQEVEEAICRIAQKARAAGIHLLLATQRPSVDVITGLIKANIPTRIAFSVSSQVDSRTILDTNGAEKLLGKGDMLFIENGANKRMRLQGPFVSDEEIDRVTNYLRSLGKPDYLFEQEQLLIEVENEEEDELLNDVISFVVEQNQASTSLLQRRFRIGYNRAARLIDTLESKGIVSAQNGSKPREVLVAKTQLEEMI